MADVKQISPNPNPAGNYLPHSLPIDDPYIDYFNDIDYIESPNESLRSVMKNTKKTDLVAIIGTHYWGEALNLFFNICFDNI